MVIDLMGPHRAARKQRKREKREAKARTLCQEEAASSGSREDAAPEQKRRLSEKEERRARKEAKRARKQAMAATG